MSDDPMPYDGDPCGCVMCADEDATVFSKGEAFCLTCWQAAILSLAPAEPLAEVVRLKEALIEAYNLGFSASAEGFNGEWYPGDHLEDEYWIGRRDKDLAALAPKGETE